MDWRECGLFYPQHPFSRKDALLLKNKKPDKKMPRIKKWLAQWTFVVFFILVSFFTLLAYYRAFPSQ
jgi:hypothetical protein